MTLAERIEYAAPAARARPARPSAEIRTEHPETGIADRGAVAMAEAMREILFRDGNVEETALIGTGFTIAEIVEHGPEARRIAGLKLVVEGQRGDCVGDFIDKARLGSIGFMPLCHATAATEDMRTAWAAYCASHAAHTLDPWISQSERTLNRLKDFLDFQPLLPREKNAVVTALAGAFRRGRTQRECRQ